MKSERISNFGDDFKGPNIHLTGETSENRKNIWRNNGQNFSRFYEIPQMQEIQWIPSTRNIRKTTQLLETSENDKIFLKVRE